MRAGDARAAAAIVQAGADHQFRAGREHRDRRRRAIASCACGGTNCSTSSIATLPRCAGMPAARSTTSNATSCKPATRRRAPRLRDLRRVVVDAAIRQRDAVRRATRARAGRCRSPGRAPAQSVPRNASITPGYSGSLPSLARRSSSRQRLPYQRDRQERLGDARARLARQRPRRQRVAVAHCRQQRRARPAAPAASTARTSPPTDAGRRRPACASRAAFARRPA